MKNDRRAENSISDIAEETPGHKACEQDIPTDKDNAIKELILERIKLVGLKYSDDITDSDIDALKARIAEIDRELSAIFDLEPTEGEFVEPGADATQKDFTATLEEAGIAESHKLWEGELNKLGFEPIGFKANPLTGETFLRYWHNGNFSVDGDHAYDVFGVMAIMSKSGITLSYRSSKLTNCYLDCYDDTDEDLREKLNKLEDFLNKHREVLHYYRKDIIISDSGSFEIAVGRVGYLRCALGKLEKLAVMLDNELCKSFPFENIHGYERIGKRGLAWTRAILEEYDPETCALYSCQYPDTNFIKNQVILSSYRATRAEALATLEDIAQKIARCADALREYESSNGGTDKRLHPRIFEDDSFRNAINDLSEMSDEEFEALKDNFFDI